MQIFNSFRKRKHVEDILMIGLEGSGKTCIFNRLIYHEFSEETETIGFNLDSVFHKGRELRIWDIGGKESMWPLITHYTMNKKSIVFVVDSTDIQFDLLQKKISFILNNDYIVNLPILFMLSKSDLLDPKYNEKDFIEYFVRELRLENLSNSFDVFLVSSVSGQNLNYCLDRLVKNI